jgi:hypothetical protein
MIGDFRRHLSQVGEHETMMPIEPVTAARSSLPSSESDSAVRSTKSPAGSDPAGQKLEAPLERGAECYFNDVLIVPKLVLSVEPRPFTATMITIEIPPARIPYSIAVAPDSSDRNFKKVRCKPASFWGVLNLIERDRNTENNLKVIKSAVDNFRYNPTKLLFAFAP